MKITATVRCGNYLYGTVEGNARTVAGVGEALVLALESLPDHKTPGAPSLVDWTQLDVKVERHG